MNEARRDDQQFRRGVVLGLTFAEILLLLIFLLMLVLAPRLVASQEEHKLRVEAQHQLAALQPVLNKLRNANDQFDITKEWVRLHDENAKVREELERYKPAIALVSRRIATQSPGRTVADATAQIEREATAGRRFINDARGLTPGATEDDALRRYEELANAGALALRNRSSNSDALKEAASCNASLFTCRAQNSNLSARLGGVLPPCWVDRDGRTQYIFDARLREDGIWLTDNRVAGREHDQSLLPLRGFQFSRAMTVASLVQAGQPLLDVSEKGSCRFYVRVFDETNAGSKARYKALLQGVEAIFYKLLMR